MTYLLVFALGYCIGDDTIRYAVVTKVKSLWSRL